jgi:hypothetical protein
MGRLRTLALALACVLVVAGCDWAQWGLGPEHAGTNLENSITTGNVSQFVASRWRTSRSQDRPCPRWGWCSPSATVC